MSSFDNEYIIKTDNSTCQTVSVAVGITLFCVLYVVLKSPYLTHKVLSIFQKWYSQALFLAVIVFMKTQSLSLAIVYSLVIVAILLTIDKVIHDASRKKNTNVPAVDMQAEHVDKNIDDKSDDHVISDENVYTSQESNELGGLLDDEQLSHESVELH